MSEQPQVMSSGEEIGGTLPPVIIKVIKNSKGINHEIRVDSTATRADVDNAIAMVAYADKQLNEKGLIA